MNWTARHSPPDIGGVDATSRRSREAFFKGADGVVGNGTSCKECILKHFINPDHPVCAAAEASHLFLDGAATPPVSGGELPASHSFTTFETAPTIDFHVLQQPLSRRRVCAINKKIPFLSSADGVVSNFKRNIEPITCA
jgi:hypothetical protein